MPAFKVVAEFEPRGDQPKAIEAISRAFREGAQVVTLLGATGTGKTATMAWVIEQLQLPTLVIAHNKTLAGQLAAEFKQFFPHNAVEYFVSYYDYYQPEAYVPQTDTYIEKDALINDEIDKLRHSATSSLFERKDVIVVASVSCIYGLGAPEDYRDLVLSLRVGNEMPREQILRKLVDIQYARNDVDFQRGTFRVRGDVIEIFPASMAERAIRVELFGDEIDRLTEIDALTGEVLAYRDHVAIYPASHYVTHEWKLKRAIESIERELEQRLAELRARDKLLEAQRLEQRTRYDLEMLREVGYCSGIENYSRHLTGRAPGEPPYTLLDYFPRPFLCIIDESHVTIPQLRAMYEGEMSRKDSLIEYGFRLPSARDNRPLKFEEFWEKVGQVLFVSATPGPFEREHSDVIVEQIVRPTGLLDPEIEVRPTRGQIEDLLGEIRQRVERGHRVLVTTLTKRMAEDLTDYLREMGVKVRYLHSEVDTLERMEIIRDLRLGVFDVLVGINLLREGLDLPEVSLVAILDADKEGYLRSTTALIQTIGRAARNVEGKVIMYADTITDSMRQAIEETYRRRKIQEEYNRRHGITPQTVRKAVRDVIEATHAAERPPEYLAGKRLSDLPRHQIPEIVKKLRKEMEEAARDLEFERAALLRDMILELEARRLGQPAGRDTLRAAATAGTGGGPSPAARRRGRAGRAGR
ncbi:excinuclease ABC subunit UvrB [Thermaerobacter subterraneus]|uniref:UvrABC system protein B n=1 Tax=Thermaerobacter subterraneus DSM 13965 TaxID=867903 RepID=K6PNZ9_9FIRM|nr:excinuclease ABC subunit UvrB [Thermaerobacter subterraneus]EKP94622.1 Excinuclease ABC subunit B [Thermaerobacter subterraneus DSM 13965]